MSTIYGFVNGIRTRPGSSKNWTGKAVTATHNRFEDSTEKAEKIEYFSFAVTRGINQKRRARKLIKVMEFYQGWNHVIAAHSNGADVVLDALRFGDFHIDHLHLFSPAVNKDCDKNGLAEYMRLGWVKKLTIYIAGKDRALWLAKSWAARRLGYGALGLDGPKNLPHPHEIIRRDNWGHSDWWHPTNFNDTMKMIWDS